MVWLPRWGCDGVIGSSQKLLMASGGVENPLIVGFAEDLRYSSSNNISFASDAIVGVEAGDLLILTAANDLSCNTQLPSGWTSGFSYNAFNGSSNYFLFYKIATSSDVSVTATYAGTSSSQNAVVLLAIRGSFVSVTDTSTTRSRNPPSVSVSNGDIVLCGFGYQDELSKPTVTAPSGYELITNTWASVTSPLSRQNGTALAYSDTLSAGTEDPSAFVSTGSTSNDFYAFSLVVTPA